MSHDKIADTFDEWARAGRDAGMEEGHGDVVRQVLEQLEIHAGEHILDLGCGNGWATRLLAKSAAGAGAVGVDISQAMIARAEELHSFTIRARYEVAPFEDLGLPDAQFTRAFSMEALYYAIDLDRALTEIHRVLKPGGILDFVVDYYGERTGTENWPEKTGLAMNRLTSDEWRDALQRAGFTDVRTQRVIDTRGPGDEADFQPSEHFPDWATKVAMHEAGSLWVHGVKPQ